MGTEELPPPSPELAALRVICEAHWRTLKPRDRLKFQKSIVDILAEMEEAPLTIRPVEEHAAQRASRVKARAWISAVLRDVVRWG